MNDIKERMENGSEQIRTIVGEDFNARIGREGVGLGAGQWMEEVVERKSKDERDEQGREKIVRMVGGNWMDSI